MASIPLQLQNQQQQQRQEQSTSSIWTEMSYTPPRGPCSQRTSLVSTCPCYRFMIHPLKASSSFDCDGCGHHACFHRMKSREEEVVEEVQVTGGKKRKGKGKGNGRG